LRRVAGAAVEEANPFLPDRRFQDKLLAAICRFGQPLKIPDEDTRYETGADGKAALHPGRDRYVDSTACLGVQLRIILIPQAPYQ
jgi:hypothetical protein